MQQNNNHIKEQDNQELLEEIQDLELQILDMFEVAFYFAGIKDEYLQDALEYYMKIIESQDDSIEYTPQIIIANILQVKEKNPKWFIKK